MSLGKESVENAGGEEVSFCPVTLFLAEFENPTYAMITI
jgi:hypothetical protein